MNVRQALRKDSTPEAIHIELNHESIMTVATNTGFRTHSLDDGRLLMLRDFDASLGFVTPVGASNIFGIIGGGPSSHWSPNKFVLWEDLSKTDRFKIETPLKPIRACLTMSHLALIFEAGLMLYSMRLESPRPVDRQARIGKYESAPNPVGLCHLGKHYAIFPGRTKGQVQVLDLQSRKNTIIPAHDGQLQALALSRNESMLATSSTKGTLIRVWSTVDSTRLFEFRRGLDKAIIFSLAFSPSGRQLAVTSDKSTLHVFDLALPEQDYAHAQSAASASRPQHSRNPSSATRPMAIPSNTTGKRASFGALATSPETVTGLATSPGTRQRRGFEPDRYSVMPSDSASQAGPVHHTNQSGGPTKQIAWNDMMRAQPQGRAVSTMSDIAPSSVISTSSSSTVRGKYGNLVNLPFAPKILSDTYSSLSCAFEMGDEHAAKSSSGAQGSKQSSETQAAMIAAGRPAKGRVAWTSDDELVVVGAGRDARWEKFRIGFYDGGSKRGIERVGWKRYMDDEGLH